jgi:hypothetical protein
VLLIAKRSGKLKKSYWGKVKKALDQGYLRSYMVYTPLKDKYLIKELEFLGWVPYNVYKLKPNYGYFITNENLKSAKYMYPVKYSDNIDTVDSAPNYQEALNTLAHGGPVGYIRYEYSLPF